MIFTQNIRSHHVIYFTFDAKFIIFFISQEFQLKKYQENFYNVLI